MVASRYLQTSSKQSNAFPLVESVCMRGARSFVGSPGEVKQAPRDNDRESPGMSAFRGSKCFTLINT